MNFTGQGGLTRRAQAGGWILFLHLITSLFLVQQEFRASFAHHEPNFDF